MKVYSVYKHTSPTGKVYVGITCRKPEHRWANGMGYTQNKHFFSAIEKYGWDNFKHEIVATGLNKSEACEMEKSLIAKYKSNLREYGYNKSTGGDAPCAGRKQEREEIEKRRMALLGKKRTEETKRNISNAKKGRSNGHEGVLGIANAKSGIVKQINESTGEVIAVYYGYDEMHRMTGYARTPIKEAVKGQRKRAYGYLWEYQKRGKLDVIV